MTVESGLQPVIAEAERQLAEAGIAEPHGEAVTLVQLAMARQASNANCSLDELMTAAITERKARRSIARIAGFKHFYGLPLQLDDDVYEPCASSERLLEHALAFASTRSAALRILDLGTGAGNLMVAALRALPAATGVGVDCNAAAVALARRNAHAHGLSNRCMFLEGDAHALSLSGFDMVFSTLPWVPTGQLDDLMPEVRLYDPVESLDGGADGLDHFQRLARSLHRLLTPQGAAFVQVGYERHAAARALLARAGAVTVLRDGYGFPMGLQISRLVSDHSATRVRTALRMRGRGD